MTIKKFNDIPIQQSNNYSSILNKCNNVVSDFLTVYYYNGDNQ